MSRLTTLALALACAAACTCGSSSPVVGGPGAGSGGAGSAAGGGAGGAPCRGVQPKVEALYRAEATAAGAKAGRVEEAVRDNTAMVLAECRQRPEISGCVDKASSARQLETECLLPLSDEGTEGDSIGR